MREIKAAIYWMEKQQTHSDVTVNQVNRADQVFCEPIDFKLCDF